MRENIVQPRIGRMKYRNGLITHNIGCLRRLPEKEGMKIGMRIRNGRREYEDE
jgi:hypothetical protein